MFRVSGLGFRVQGFGFRVSHKDPLKFGACRGLGSTPKPATPEPSRFQVSGKVEALGD